MPEFEGRSEPRPAPAGAAFRIEQVGYGHPDAMLLIAEVQAEYVVRYGGQDETPLDPLMFEPPSGSFFVGYLGDGAGDRPAATGAWRAHADVEVFGTRRTAEVKRMYVVPEARGAGLARRMLAHLERTAAASGAEAMILETGTKQPEAIGLYESSGYSRIPSFGHYRNEPENRCFAKRLAEAARDAAAGLRPGG